jgi:hypothetical protein
MADPRPFKLWRDGRGAAAAVLASGTVDDDGALDVTEIVAPFKLPAEAITLAELEATAERASHSGLRVWVEVEGPG